MPRLEWGQDPAEIAGVLGVPDKEQELEQWIGEEELERLQQAEAAAREGAAIDVEARARDLLASLVREAAGRGRGGNLPSPSHLDVPAGGAAGKRESAGGGAGAAPHQAPTIRSRNRRLVLDWRASCRFQTNLQVTRAIVQTSGSDATIKGGCCRRACGIRMDAEVPTQVS